MNRDVVIERTARRCWEKRHRADECPPAKIPVEKDLAEWLPSCPDDALREAERRLRIVLNHPNQLDDGRWTFVAARVGEPVSGITTLLCDGGGNALRGLVLAVAHVYTSTRRRAKLTGLPTIHWLEPGEKPPAHAKPLPVIDRRENNPTLQPESGKPTVIIEPDGSRVIEMIDVGSWKLLAPKPPREVTAPTMTVDELYAWVLRRRELFRELPSERESAREELLNSDKKVRASFPEVLNPLMPLMEAWQATKVESLNTRSDPLVPGLVVTRKTGTAITQRTALRMVSPQGHFPGFGFDDQSKEMPPGLLRVFDLGGGQATTKGHGAPIALRTFFFVIMATPSDYRSGLVDLPPIPFSTYLTWLYPDGMKYYRPARHWRLFEAAFEELDRTRIVWEDRKTRRGGATRIVWARTIPRQGRRQDWIRFGLDFPPGSESGPIMDREALRRAGVRSAPAFRLAVSLSFAWHRPGVLRRPVGRQGHWVQATKPHDYPEASAENLLAWTFPVGYSGRRGERLESARKALAHLESNGFARVVVLPGLGKRIMPGEKWAGWPETGHKCVTP